MIDLGSATHASRAQIPACKFKNVATALVMWALVTGCVSKNEVTPERCADLRDHVVDLRLCDEST